MSSVDNDYATCYALYMKKYLILLVLFLIVGSTLIVFWRFRISALSPADKKTIVADATFACPDNKSVHVIFYEQPQIAPVSQDAMPTPTGSAKISLSDGRDFTLPQTISADGARYATADDSLVLWNKGSSVTFWEKNIATYTDCVDSKK